MRRGLCPSEGTWIFLRSGCRPPHKVKMVASEVVSSVRAFRKKDLIWSPRAGISCPRKEGPALEIRHLGLIPRSATFPPCVTRIACLTFLTIGFLLKGG